MRYADTIKTVLEMFAIPLSMLFIGWLVKPRPHSAGGIKQWLKDGRLNSPTELFVFIGSLDFVYLLKSGPSIPRINQNFVPLYSAVFVGSVLVSLILLIIAAKTEFRIHEYLTNKHRKNHDFYYPIVEVCGCWVMAMALITFHLVVLFGGQS
ncbi:MAG: hypothetical protein WA738_02475 [Candidatus Angelobacter sp.]